jgi:hypothetical protein
LAITKDGQAVHLPCGSRFKRDVKRLLKRRGYSVPPDSRWYWGSFTFTRKGLLDRDAFNIT